MGSMDPEPYRALRWRDVPIADLATPRFQSLAAQTHFMLVTRSGDAGADTVAGRVDAFAHAVATIYNGLDASDGDRLAAEWLGTLGDLASAGIDGVRGWAAVYGESTGGWWPVVVDAVPRGRRRGCRREG